MDEVSFNYRLTVTADCVSCVFVVSQRLQIRRILDFLNKTLCENKNGNSEALVESFQDS